MTTAPPITPSASTPRACLLLMSNSVRAEGIYKALVEALLGDVRMPWKWEGYTPEMR